MKPLNILALFVGIGIAGVSRVFEWPTLPAALTALLVPVAILITAELKEKYNG